MNYEYSIRGKELSTLIIQPGFVEGIVKDDRHFSDMEKALIHIFRNNKEYGIILWNGIPIRLSYTRDIPGITTGLLSFLKQISDGNKEALLHIATENLDCEWKAVLNDDRTIVDLTGDFRKIPGRYEIALNTLSLLSIRKDLFLSEWKLVLEQIWTAIEDSGCKLKGEKNRNILEILRTLNTNISQRGIIYQYDKR